MIESFTGELPYGRNENFVNIMCLDTTIACYMVAVPLCVCYHRLFDFNITTDITTAISRKRCSNS